MTLWRLAAIAVLLGSALRPILAAVVDDGRLGSAYYLAGEDREGSSSFTGGDGAAGWTNVAQAVLSTPSAGGDYVLPPGSLLRTGASAYVFPGDALWSLGGAMLVEQDSLTVKTAEVAAVEFSVAILNSAADAAIEGETWSVRESSALVLNLESGDSAREVSFFPSLVGGGEVRVALAEPAGEGSVRMGFYGANELATGDWHISSGSAEGALTVYFDSPLAWPSSPIISKGSIAIDIGGSDPLPVIDRGSITASEGSLTLATETDELVLDIPIACNGFTVEESGHVVLAGDNPDCTGIITLAEPLATLELRSVNAVGQATLDLNGATLSLDVTDFAGGLRLAKTPISQFRLELKGSATFDENRRIILFRLPASEEFDLGLIQGEPSISLVGFAGEYVLGTTVVDDERLVYFFAEGNDKPVMADCYRLKSQIRVDGYGGDTYPNVPVLVRLSPARIGGFDYALVDKEHLAFTAADGSLCGYQIEKWDESGESLVWVRVPLLENGSRTTIDFWFDHDGPDCCSQQVTFGSEEFWDKNNMKTKEDYTSSSAAESTREPFAPTIAFASRLADGSGALDVTLSVSGATERCAIMAALAETLPDDPDDPASWDRQLMVAAALSNGQETVTWRLNAGWGAEFKFIKFFLCRNYRSVVYNELRGDGNAYIDLGRKGTGDDSYELQLRYPMDTPPKAGMRIFGAREEGREDLKDTVFFQKDDKSLVLDYWMGNDFRLLGSSPASGEIYRAILSPSVRELDRLDGNAWTELKKNDKAMTESVEFQSHLQLFSIGGESGSFPDSTYCNFTGAILSYTCCSTLTDEPREQLVPAKLLSSAAAGLVDLKSGRFFENAAKAGGFTVRGTTGQVVVGALAGERPVAATTYYRYRKPGFSIIGR